MHILEQYALACGVKIRKPFILEKFFPLPFDKRYIVFHAPSKFQSRKYDYWKQVLILLRPYLEENNIKIVQIGSKEEELFEDFCYVSNGQTNLNQLAYLIKNSELLLGIDSFPIHIAGFYDKKIVGLYCNMYKEHSKPYWGNPDKQKLIESSRNNLKPSYSAIEQDKTINLIKPEEIAKQVLDLLNIKNSIFLESLFFGSNYSNPIIEMIPSNPVDISNLNIDQINVRMDQLFNMEVLESQLSISKCCILSDKPIDLDFIKRYKNQITKIIFFIDNSFEKDYMFEFNNLGIEYELVSFASEEEVNNLKINYMDINHVVKVNVEDAKTKVSSIDLDNASFSSSKKTLFNQKIYPSLYHAKFNIPYGNSNIFKTVKDPLFLKDLEFFYIFKQNT